MRPKKLRTIAAGLIAGCGHGLPAQAQQPPPSPWAQPPPPPLMASSGSPPAHSRSASSFESTTLYVASAAYGLGIGIWLDVELSFDDPALLLIPPSLLGVGIPVAAYGLSRPALPRGVPGAIAAGLVIGAGEGLGIAGLQMTTSEQPWGFHGLARAMAIGSTAGGIAGIALGELQRPSPNISAFATSGVVWGSAIGAAFGLGLSPADVGFEHSNDWMARGGLIGFNAGLVATMGLATAFVPSLDQLTWMWLGGGMGALVSLPVYLFYLGDGPPAKRGLVFSATATTLGIVVGGVFGPSWGGVGWNAGASRWASVEYFTPVPVPGGMAFRLGGSLF
jgi:hypothetical protein